VFAPRNTTGLATAMLQRSVLFADGLAGKAGQVSDIAVDMTLLTFDILQATLFTGDNLPEIRRIRGGDIEAAADDGADRPDGCAGCAGFRAAPDAGAGSAVAGVFPAIDRRHDRAAAGADAARAGGGAKGPADAAARSGGARPRRVEDNIITFIGAGHETTARALGWALYLLSQAPEELAKVEAEIDTHDFSDPNPSGWVDKLVVTRSVFEEAMRLYHRRPRSTARHLPTTRSATSVSPRTPRCWCCRGLCTGTGGCGRGRTSSCRRGSCPISAGRSTVTSTFRSGSVRGSASGNLLPCRKGDRARGA